MRLLAVLVVTVLLAACGGTPDSPTSTDGPDYTPVPDQDLFQQVRQIDGVTTVDLGYADHFGNSSAYQGEVTVTAGTDELATLDHVIAVLRQGRQDATMNVSLSSPTRTVTALTLGVRTLEQLNQRYGEQPGNGEPPAELP